MNQYVRLRITNKFLSVFNNLKIICILNKFLIIQWMFILQLAFRLIYYKLLCCLSRRKQNIIKIQEPLNTQLDN